MSRADREREAFLTGERDFYDGIPIGDCPYAMSITEPDDDLALHWCRGWRSGEAGAAKLTLELQLHPVCADNAAERALLAWVINTRDKAEADSAPRTLH